MTVRNIQRSANIRASNQNIIGFGLLAVAILGAGILIRIKPGSASQADPKPIVVAEFNTVELPVPAEPVAAGTRVKDIKFKTVAFPSHQVPPGALTSFDAVLEEVSIAALPANLPLFRENFSLSSAQGNPVIERIPQGMRAMTIRVDATSSVEGWAGSGSLVDVLLVGKERSSVVAEKVRILSAERSVNPVEGSSAPNVPSTITLLVTQEQCLAINTAIPLGKIAFALRSTRDEEQWLDPVYTAERLRGAPTVEKPKGSITGYVAVQENGAEKKFALSDGKWLVTEAKPSGFLVAEDK